MYKRINQCSGARALTQLCFLFGLCMCNSGTLVTWWSPYCPAAPAGNNLLDWIWSGGKEPIWWYGALVLIVYNYPLLTLFQLTLQTIFCAIYKTHLLFFFLVYIFINSKLYDYEHHARSILLNVRHQL